MPEFNPYRKWLGIPERDLPANHYRLLSIQLFESDPEVIKAAADQRMDHVDQYSTGPHVAHAQRILNELSTARLCLCDPVRKKAYDAQLENRTDKPVTIAPADADSVQKIRPQATPISGSNPKRPIRNRSSSIDPLTEIDLTSTVSDQDPDPDRETLEPWPVFAVVFILLLGLALGLAVLLFLKT